MDDEPKCGMTIKGVPVATRQTMTALAANDRTSIAELLVGMVRREKAARATEHAREGEDAIEPPAGRVVSPMGTHQPSLGAEQLADLMHGMAALAAATSTAPARRDIRRAYHLVDAHIRDASGMPPRPQRARVGRAFGQAKLEHGKPEHLNGHAQ